MSIAYSLYRLDNLYHFHYTTFKKRSLLPCSMIAQTVCSFFLFFFYMTHQMPHRQPRMIQQHPRSGKTHNLPDLFPFLRFVAMHLTVRTECLFFHKRTFLTSQSGIIGKFLTDRTQSPCLPFFFHMMLSAIQPNHLVHNTLLFLSFLFYPIHLTQPLVSHSFPTALSSPAGRNITGGIPKPLRYRFFQSVHSSCR